MTNKQIIFDIETGPLPEDQIIRLMPEFQAPSNYKDAEKISQYIARAKGEWLERAALSALTGQVLCVGLLKGETFHVLGHADEANVLETFWDIWRDDYGSQLKMIGFACRSFDIPFLIRRSWLYQVPVPKDVLHLRFRDGGKLLDLQDEWQLGSIGPHLGDTKKQSLNNLAGYFGLGKKTANGKDFHLLWNTDRPTALAYLENDLLLTAALAQRLAPNKYD